MLEKNIIYNFERVSRLSTILNYELSTSVLFILAYFVGLSFLITFMLPILIASIAVVFLPYLIYNVIKEKRNGRILVFFVVVVIPFLISLFIGMKIDNLSLTLISVACFYLYCFMLKYSVTDWIKEYNWQLVLEEQKMEKQQ